jgi:ABC-2 type transport system permease protein
MKNIWLVMKHDIGVTLRQPSFWLLAFVMPIVLMGFIAYSRLYDAIPAAERLNQGEDSDANSPAAQTGVGLVDEGGLVQAMPSVLPSDLFIPFASERDGLAALEAGDMAQIVVIDPDYVTTGEVIIYDQNFQIRMNGDDMGVAFDGPNQWVLATMLDYNLVGDEQLLSQLANPVPSSKATPHIINPQPVDAVSDQAMAQTVAAVMPYIFYFLLLMGGSYMMRAVVAEKESRTAELLLLSLSPRDLMVGKMLAMSVIVLIQIVAWVGAGRFILGWGADRLNMDIFSFPPGFFFWAALFLLFGFLLFAAVMGAAGALANNPREGGQIIWLLVVPLMPTLMFSDLLASEPNHPLTLFLSLFPLSAPNAMVTRLAVSQVPLWQILASLALLVLTTYLIILFTSRFFRAGNLVSDTAFNFKRLVTAWR